jgi:hypothetical protein
VTKQDIERQTRDEIARGQWPTWPFTKLTPEQVRRLAREQNKPIDLSRFEPAPF